MLISTSCFTACRSELDQRKVFKLQYFEPTKKEVAKESGEDIAEDDFDAEIGDFLAKRTGMNVKKERDSSPIPEGKGKGKRVIKEDSDDEKTDGDEEDVKPKARKAKTKAAKKRVVKDSVSR